ncbi:MAG: MBOAT family O-acyltransferase [Candidatus Obscuribacterales bacterium]
MLFTTIQYAYFLPLVVALFWLLPKSARLPLLLVASYLFYASWMAVFLLLLIPLTVFNYMFAPYIQRSEKHKKLLFGTGVAVNLAVLGTFKYANFALASIASMIGITTGHAPDWAVNIILPLGISFFVFEFIHYLFEVYRGGELVRSFTLFALFAAFFPTQIAGPIKRYPDFVAQMLEDRKLKLQYFDEGMPLIVMGLVKKLLLADNLASFVQMGLNDPGAFGAIEMWLYAYAFAFQIFFDFSGYTDIARGSAMLFGYHIPLNFNLPYIANNISEFWHRWHISLSTWLRDYLFIPLGGSRGGRWNVNRNLLLTMTLGGLWHGASWNFVVWGIYHGLLLVVHREFRAVKEATKWLKTAVDSYVGKVLCTFLTFQAVCIGWIFFRVQDMSTAFNIVKKMVFLRPLFTKSEVGGHLLVLNQNLPVVVPITLAMIAGLLVGTAIIVLAQGKVHIKLNAPAQAVLCFVGIILVVTFLPVDQQPFIYFQF